MKLTIGLCAFTLSVGMMSCASKNSVTTTQTSIKANAGTQAMMSTATAAALNAPVSHEQQRLGPDNSEIIMTVLPGLTTETRTFRNDDSRLAKVVVMTRDGKRTATVIPRYEKLCDMPAGKISIALTATDAELGDAIGYTAAKAELAKKLALEDGESAAPGMNGKHIR